MLVMELRNMSGGGGGVCCGGPSTPLVGPWGLAPATLPRSTMAPNVVGR